MEYISLLELKRKIFKRTALIPIDGIEEILDLNDNLSGDEILFEIISKSLKDFEYYHPLIMDIKVNTQCLNKCKKDGYYEMRDNFHLYLDGRLLEDQINLIPNSVIGIRVENSWTYPGNYFNATNYERPYLQMANFSEGVWVIRGIFSRPIIEKYTPDMSFSEESKIYYLSIDSGVLSSRFLDQVLCNLLEYIRNLKANFQLPNFPAEIFGAADVAYQQVKQELDQYYLQSNWRGELII